MDLQLINFKVYKMLNFIISVSLINLVYSVRQYADSDGFLMPPKKLSIFSAVSESRFKEDSKPI